MAEGDGLYPVEQGMVLVLGETGAGKSYFIRKLTSNSAVIVGHSLESCEFIAPSDLPHLSSVFARDNDLPLAFATHEA
jgi:ABC-type hemin transport system ATPase subunit